MKEVQSKRTPKEFNGGSNYKDEQAATKNVPNSLIKEKIKLDYENPDYSIAVDWLELFCQSEDLSKYILSLCLEEASPEQEFIFNESISLIYYGHGTRLYKYLFQIKINNIPFCDIQLIPRKKVGVMTEETLSLKINNYHLYRYGWTNELINLLSVLKITVLNITRLDIAVDNVNHLKKFMIDFIKQDENNMKFIYAGKSEISYKKMDYFLNFQSIQIGSAASEKCVVIYNKGKEIKQSNKDYIKLFWDNNLKKYDENDIYRIELRLKSKAIKEFTNLTIEMLENENILKEIFTTQGKNLLDFRIKDDVNITRCSHICILTLENTSSILLREKIKYIPNDIYKAKLSIHLIYKLLCHKEIEYSERFVITQTARHYLNKYNLKKWYEKRKEYWQEIYGYPKEKI